MFGVSVSVSNVSAWRNCLICGQPLWSCTHAQPNSVAPASSLGDGPNLPPSPEWYGYFGLPVPPEHDPERFPHRCPKCGEWAYVGITVDHERETDCR